MEPESDPVPNPISTREVGKYSAHHDEEVDIAEISPMRAPEPNIIQPIIGPRTLGWRSGIYYGIAIDVSVLVVVLILIFVAAFAYPRDGSLSVLIEGSCSKTQSWGIWLHLLINVLSTLLLATSSYAMQCLIAPTRDDIDKAHRRGKFMNIGVPTITNVFHVNRRRAGLYVLAILSSIPIHLLANSIVFESFSTNSYLLTLAYQQFIDEPLSGVINSTLGPVSEYAVSSFNSDRNFSDGDGERLGNPDEDVFLSGNLTVPLKMLTSNMTRLDNEDCIRRYSKPLLTDRRHVIAVTEAQPPPVKNESQFSNTLAYWYQSIDTCPECQTYLNWTDPTIWTCAFLADESQSLVRSCDSSAAASRATQFEIRNKPISYCLSEEVDEKCRLQADIGIMSAVTVCAAVKICVLAMATYIIPGDIISTLGDAVSSFLDQPEEMTADCCLLTADDVRRRQSKDGNPVTEKSADQRRIQASGSIPSVRYPWEREQLKWIPGKPFLKYWLALSMKSKYNEAVPLRHWMSAAFVLLSILVLAIALLVTAVVRIRTNTGLEGSNFGSAGTPPSSIPALWRMGFGAINANFLLPLRNMSSALHSDTVQHVLIVNAPQIALSVSYFVYNDLWTNILIAREWATYGTTRQGLRVSQPRGDFQRSSYFLTIPYAFAIPLQISSALLHWLLSQSIFLARVDVYSGEPFVNRDVGVINTVGYSPIALFFLILLWAVLLAVIYLTGILFKLNSPIPIVGSCSLAISAACHPPNWEQHNGDIALKEVMWGVTPIEITDRNVELERIEEIENEARHCSFSAEEVISPETLPMREGKRTGLLKSKMLFK